MTTRACIFAVIGAAFGAAAWACFGDVVYSGKACPCPDGYLCDDAVKRCVSDQIDCTHRGCETFASVDDPSCLAADDANVYFAVGPVLYAQAPGAMSATVLATVTGNVTSCTLGTENVYVSTDAPLGLGVRRADGVITLSTGAVATIAELVGDDVASWKMIWSQQEPLKACSAPADGGCTCTNCKGNLMVTSDGGTVQVAQGFEHVALGDREIFFVQGAQKYVATFPRGNAGDVAVIGSDPADLVAAQAGVVAWADLAQGSVSVVNDAGPVVVASNVGSQVTDLRIANGAVYWLSAGTIARAPLGGGATEVLVGGINATRIAVSADWVYWLDGAPAASGGGIHRHALK